MCGLVGVISKRKYGFYAKQLDVFENMLYADAVRGEDSTGVFCVNNKGNVNIAKEIGESTFFLGTKEWKDIRTKAITNGWALIGHNRKATKGSITDENAHPFWVDDKLVLVHNGSLLNHRTLLDTDVDSNALAHALAQGEDVEKTLQRVNGAYALIWQDIKNKTINVIRNAQRPLWWCETDDAYYLASEPGLLYFALWRNDEKIINKKDQPAVHKFEENVLTTMNIDGKMEARKLDCAYRFPATTVTPTTTDEYYDAWTTPVCPVAPGDKQEVADVVESKPLEFPDGYALTPYKEWAARRNGRYVENRRITVAVEDYSWEPGATEDMWLCARTLDEFKTFVMFRTTMKEIQEVGKAFGQNQEVLYNVMIKQYTWKQEKAATNFDASEGYASIHAINANRIPVTHIEATH